MTTPIVVIGAHGRMGQAIIDMAAADPDFLVTGVARPGDHKSCAVPLYQGLEAALAAKSQPSPVIIDFSRALELESHLSLAQRYACGLLIGSTGHEEAALTTIAQAALTIPIVLAPNTSLLANLMKSISGLLASLLPSADVDILDIHHRHKKDRPSGTALALAQAIATGRGDKASSIDIQSMRAGDVVGEHRVYFHTDFERLELNHQVTDRRVFAKGALLAAQFLYGRAPGLYCMNDVLKMNLTIEKML